MSSSDLLEGLPTAAPAQAKAPLRFIDVAVTATANEFAGIYRNKQYHEPDFDAVLDRAAQAGVDKVMLTGMSLGDVEVHRKLAAARPQQCSYTIGVHPYHAAEPAEDPGYLERLGDAVAAALLKEERTPCPVAAFGELGLDYDRLDRCPGDVQIQTFRAQLDLYLARGFTALPLFLHCRGAAFDDFVAIMREYIPRISAAAAATAATATTDRTTTARRHGLVHSFVGTSSQMQLLTTELGLDVSVNGFSFRDRPSIEMVRDVPLEHLHIETDAPWGLIPATADVARRYLVNAPPLPASKKRDKFDQAAMVKERNESCCIDRVAYIVAGIKGLAVEEVCDRARENSAAMFGL
ncbi:TatD family hydrolase [Microdochium trichocladiopsis]|uniref:TatD family hydrolase n=1 Tax=Microdochium trichocladiopsis TaxID=1682393 RepID=A0A9P8XYM9_9PEZI|nr:TatD family hydrolase [Microdochium trichocladiopsis]KAH7024965.1 TatD family hydrolase [Microdochium trichocladiopsis]